MPNYRFVKFLFVAIALFGSTVSHAQEHETLPAIAAGAKAPNSFKAMWAGFDPQAEPLEIETVKEWEEDGAVLRIVRFRIGIFKGKKSQLAGIYGYPKYAVANGEKVPGLLQIHGGGQFADHKACVANAKRGYATISISWAGRISAPGYRVDPSVVKLFWDAKTNDPKYKLTTDWGALDGYHAPTRNPKNNFPNVTPAEWTIDSIESPRNSPWFICALAARRALTFLEQQPEVDPKRLGVYGHSMGGKLTVMTAFDSRVKAAAPSCGGISDRDNSSELFRATVDDGVNLEQISCPIMFLSPSNDFHGRIGDLPTAIKEISGKQWRVTCSPHGSHQDAPEFEVATMLWFDQHLKRTFSFPETPRTVLQRIPVNGVFILNIEPDPNVPYSLVDVFYTQHGKAVETRFDGENTKSRFWRHIGVKEKNKLLTVKLSQVNPGRPLWVYANVTYPLDRPVSGVGYYYGAYTSDKFNLSSLLIKVSPEQLKAAGVKNTVKAQPLIENFKGDWEKEWYSYKPSQWPRSTHKVYDQSYAAPENAKLSLQVRSKEKNTLVVNIDGHAAERELDGEDWQTLVLDLGDFKNCEGESLKTWKGIMNLELTDKVRLRPKRGSSTESRTAGKPWKGKPPEFQNLKWD